MKAVKLATEDAPYKAAAAIDARMRNIAGASHYPQAKKIRAERVKYALELVYNAANIFINYRQKFIAVKVSAPTVYNKKDLALLEGDWTKEGITKHETAQGIIYRIPA